MISQNQSLKKRFHSCFFYRYVQTYFEYQPINSFTILFYNNSICCIENGWDECVLWVWCWCFCMVRLRGTKITSHSNSFNVSLFNCLYMYQLCRTCRSVIFHRVTTYYSISFLNFFNIQILKLIDVHTHFLIAYKI